MARSESLPFGSEDEVSDHSEWMHKELQKACGIGMTATEVSKNEVSKKFLANRMTLKGKLHTDLSLERCNNAPAKVIGRYEKLIREIDSYVNPDKLCLRGRLRLELREILLITRSKKFQPKLLAPIFDHLRIEMLDIVPETDVNYLTDDYSYIFHTESIFYNFTTIRPHDEFYPMYSFDITILSGMKDYKTHFGIKII